MDEVQIAPSAGAVAATVPPSRALFDAAQELGLSIALWRAPQTGAPAPCVNGIVSLESTLRAEGVDFLRDGAGFAFAPFAEGSPGHFLREDVRLCGDEVRVGPLAAADAGALLRAYSDRRIGHSPLIRAWHTVAAAAAERAITHREFEALVRDAIAFIELNRVAKVVVSRTTPVELPPDFHPVDLFDALCARHPHAFVSLVSAPGAGTWLGATPELLLGLDGDALTTVALAGTQKRNGVPLEQIGWGRKERIEQEMVSAYVRGFFTGAGVRGLQEKGPQTMAAGGVVHLQTHFRVPMEGRGSLRLANRVLTDLHPTSAVCGMPRGAALSFIQAREGYDRAFYSGYLGPVHVDGQSALYVNLRCMQLRAPRPGSLSASASLYVGAGITAESEPASEWRETEMKARTILDALQLPQIPPAPSL